MRQFAFIFSLLFILILSSCDDEPDTMTGSQSDKCNSGDKATLALVIDGIGTYNYQESSSSISHASDTEGSGIDAVSLFMRWTDSATGDSLLFDVTVEFEDLQPSTTYNYDNASFNGSVNFYIYSGGAQTEHFTFSDWETTVTEFDVFATQSAGGFTTTRLAYIDAMSSGTFTRVGMGTSHNFTAAYTICPEY